MRRVKSPVAGAVDLEAGQPSSGVAGGQREVQAECLPADGQLAQHKGPRELRDRISSWRRLSSVCSLASRLCIWGLCCWGWRIVGCESRGEIERCLLCIRELQSTVLRICRRQSLHLW